VAAVSAATVLVLAGGCGTKLASLPIESPAATASQTVTPSTPATVQSSVTPTPSTSPSANRIEPSAKALDYAKSLGGSSHEGERLYLIIGASVGTENQAQVLLDRATPAFGDMQTYFIVQRSDNFDGLTPGFWVLIEAHRAQPSAEDMQLAKRGFRDAYVKSAIARTSDPIPVYEDLVSQ
jgi:hypothetical protein